MDKHVYSVLLFCLFFFFISTDNTVHDCHCYCRYSTYTNWQYCQSQPLVLPVLPLCSWCANYNRYIFHLEIISNHFFLSFSLSRDIFYWRSSYNCKRNTCVFTHEVWSGLDLGDVSLTDEIRYNKVTNLWCKYAIKRKKILKINCKTNRIQTWNIKYKGNRVEQKCKHVKCKYENRNYK